MGRALNKFVADLLRPPIVVLGFVIKQIYSLFFGWYEKRLARKAQDDLETKIREHVSFLFTEYSAQFLPNRKIKRQSDIDWPAATVMTDKLLLRFRQWRDELHVHIAPQFAPEDWHEFSVVLSAIESGDIKRHPPLLVQDIGRILRPQMTRLEEALSGERYPVLKARLSEYYKFRKGNHGAMGNRN